MVAVGKFESAAVQSVWWARLWLRRRVSERDHYTPPDLQSCECRGPVYSLLSYIC